MSNPIQPKLLRLLRSKGYLAFSLNATGMGLRGLPDVWALKDGKLFLFEIKYGNDKLSVIQKTRIKQLKNLGFDVIIIKDNNDIIKLGGLL